MKYTLNVLLLLVPILTYGQVKDSTITVHEQFDTFEELKEKKKKANIDILTYLDSTFNFQVSVPNWLTLFETKSNYAWGGTLPETKGIVNAILIKSFDKKDYPSLMEFKKYIIEDISFGQTAKWSEKHKFMGKKELESYHNIGQTYKVYWMIGNLMYHCEYVLLETKTAYLWIDFTSTKETFDINVLKFEEFLNGFKVTE